MRGKPRRPGERLAGGRGVGDRPAQPDVALDELRDEARREPPPAARRRDAERVERSWREGDAAPRHLRRLAGMEQPEVDLRPRMEPEPPQRLDEGRVVGSRRDRHVEPVESAPEPGRERIRKVDHRARIGRHVAGLLLVVARRRSGTRARPRPGRAARCAAAGRARPRARRGTAPARRPRASRARGSCPTGPRAGRWGSRPQSGRARGASPARRPARPPPDSRRRRRRSPARAASAARPGSGSRAGRRRRASAPRRCGTRRRPRPRTRANRTRAPRRPRLGRRRSRGNARYDRGVGGATSNCGRELSTGYCQTIQSARGPVSPSGIRRTRVPSSPATRRNTASALASGTLPTRCAPRGTKPAPVDVG